MAKKAKPQPPAAVGERVYYCDDTREYLYMYRGIYRGDTSRSWLVGDTWSPKKLPKASTVFFSAREYATYTWARSECWRVGDAVRSLHDPAKLLAVARIVGYAVPPEIAAAIEREDGAQ